MRDYKIVNLWRETKTGHQILIPVRSYDESIYLCDITSAEREYFKKHRGDAADEIVKAKKQIEVLETDLKEWKDYLEFFEPIFQLKSFKKK